MTSDRSELIEALASLDKLRVFVSNLEKLRTDGSITEEQYQLTKREYDQRLSTARMGIAQLKEPFKKKLENSQREIETCKYELRKLEIKYKVEELAEEQYVAADRKVRAQIEAVEADIAELIMLINAQSIADLPTLTRAKTAPIKSISEAETAMPSPISASVKAVTHEQTGDATSVQQTTVTYADRKKQGIFTENVAKWFTKRTIVWSIAGLVVIIIVGILLVTIFSNNNLFSSSKLAETAIPVDIKYAKEVGTLHFEIVYDSASYKALRVDKNGSFTDILLESDISNPGHIIVGIISGGGINGNGTIATIVLQKTKGGTGRTISLENVIAFDKAATVELPVKVSQEESNSKSPTATIIEFLPETE
jgi:hypothetical protein